MSKRPRETSAPQNDGDVPHLMIVDARDPGEPTTYVVKMIKEKVPKCLRRALKKNPRHEHVYFEDGSEGMGGLVDESKDNAEEQFEEISEYLEKACSDEFKLELPSPCINYYISIAAI